MVVNFQKGTTMKIHNHGVVELIDIMPGPLGSEGYGRGDQRILDAARISYGKEGKIKTEKENKGLIRYMMRHGHTSPFEQVEFVFYIKLPVFIMKQLVRHRMANLNEFSGRYSEMPDEYWVPELEDSNQGCSLRFQSKTNKQGSGDEDRVEKEDSENAIAIMNDVYEYCNDSYHKLLDEGIAKEQARVVLPLAAYTKIYWKCDLRNLFNFFNLRCDNHAQAEFRVYADCMLKMVKPYVPLAIEAWEDYSEYRGAMKFSRLEIECLHALIAGDTLYHEIGIFDNEREKQEWLAKRKELTRI